MAIEQRYTAFEKAKNYTKQYELDGIDSIVTRQEDGMLGYVSAGQFATTGSNIFEGGQIIDGNLTIVGDIYANEFLVTTSSIEHFTASTNFGLDDGDIHSFTGSVRISGSLSVIGGINGVINATNGVVSSSAQITALGFISSSQTLDTASLATTGSNLFRGDQTITGSLFISGTTELGGNIVPKTARGATLGTSERPFREIYVQSGSINIASDIIGDPNTTLSNVGGNILVSTGGMRLLGDASFIAATGSFQYISGSMTQVGDYNQTGNYTMVGDKIITGSLTLSSGSALRINNGFYVDGNRQFNYGQFSDLTIQSASADTAYPMKLNTTDVSMGVSVVSGSFIKVANTGTYNLQFSAQLEQTSNNASEVSIWLRKDGTNVPNSNTELTIEKIGGGGKMVAAWNYMIQLNANQYVQLMWCSTRSDTQLHYHAAQSTPTRPATPSVIVTLTQVA